jgi:hypothetical protein
MPATSERQRRFMCADMGRAEAGKKTRTGMSKGKLEDFCTSKKKHMTPGDGTGMDFRKIPSENALTAEPKPARGR